MKANWKVCSYLTLLEANLCAVAHHSSCSEPHKGLHSTIGSSFGRPELTSGW